MGPTLTPLQVFYFAMILHETFPKTWVRYPTVFTPKLVQNEYIDPEKSLKRRANPPNSLTRWAQQIARRAQNSITLREAKLLYESLESSWAGVG